MSARKLIIVTIIIAVFACFYAFAEEPVTVKTLQFPFQFTMGAWYGVKDFEPQSLAYITLAEYSGLLDIPIGIDLGLLNFEQVEVSGDNWWNDLDPVIGIHVDTMPVLEKLPILGTWLEKIPDALTVGGGITAPLDDLGNVDLGVYIGFSL